MPVTFWVYVCSGRDYRDARVLEPRQVHDPGHVAAVQGLVDGRPIDQRADHQRHASGTKPRWPLDRSSSTTQSMPSCRNARTTCEPM